jgi:hypothetical protein
LEVSDETIAQFTAFFEEKDFVYKSKTQLAVERVESDAEDNPYRTSNFHSTFRKLKTN